MVTKKNTPWKRRASSSRHQKIWNQIQQTFASSSSSSKELGFSSQRLTKVFFFEYKDSMEASSRKSPKGVLDSGLRWPSESSSSNGGGSYSSTGSSTHSSSSQWSWLSRLLKPKSIRRSVTFPASTTTVAKHDSSHSKPSWRSFSLPELKAATNNFNPDNFIGKGGYAEVYKGCLEDGQVVAIKKLTRGTTEAQTNNFLSEVGVIVHLDHPNIAKLIGFCIEGGMHIVLQFSPLGSLSSHLHDREEGLVWSIRYRIAVGTSQALEYLHYKCPRRIIHRDIKAANILLSGNFEPQICDFGLAKWLPSQWTHHNLPSYEGTFGYLAPECIMHGIVDEKTDVFAFGVVLLELITGRRALDSSMNSLVIWARPLLEANDTQKLVDSSLGDLYDHTQFDCLVYLASVCLRESAPLRPTMGNVLKILRVVDSGSRSTDPRMVLRRRTFFSDDGEDEMLGLEEEYNTNTRKYMNDLRIHKQIAFDM